MEYYPSCEGQEYLPTRLSIAKAIWDDIRWHVSCKGDKWWEAEGVYSPIRLMNKMNLILGDNDLSAEEAYYFSF